MLRRSTLGFDFGLTAATVAVYAQTVGFDFAGVDDPTYVTKNPHVLGGLTPGNVAWAFRTFEASNWHPLTWISLMLDATIGGRSPAVFHATNVILHVLATLLLFHVLAAMTRSAARSATVAALFALHPLHVESVAWISERKDVLSTVFWFLGIAAYLRWVRRPSGGAYAVVVAAFVLGLLSKPMLVTFPLTLMLLDVWPLERRALLEKLPLLALSAASCVVTLAAQWSIVGSLQVVPLGARAANAIVSYGVYAEKMFWPHPLSIHYPYVIPIAEWQIAVSLIALVAAVVLAWRLRRPYLVTGVGWYLVTLVPVIGIVQVGEQSRADRYTYVPLVGLFIVVVWGVADLVRRRVTLAWSTAVVLTVLACVSYGQAAVWRDGLTLFGHAVEVDAGNALARMGLANELAARGRDAEAIGQYREALKSRPDALFALERLAACLSRTGRGVEAIDVYRRILTLDPAHAVANANLGVLLMQEGKQGEADEALTQAVRSRPGDADLFATLGAVRTREGKLAEAEASFVEALRIDPGHALAHDGIAVVLGNTGRTDEAIAHLRRSLEIDPRQSDARVNLARLLVQRREIEAARSELQEGARLSPSDPAIRQELERLTGGMR
ncbi:MAG TPA: tetratricopeptide repeat protein [Candidatus Polarisedimenticolaceae bacterium]|nr:tetratricopeptide repeat protein [Candidatus Polarisedimenticolaceae bacterium]